MQLRDQRLLQFLVLGGLGLFILGKYVTGNLVWYINKRYMPLSIIAILGFLGMAAATILSLRRSAQHPHEHDHDHDHNHDQSPESAPLLASIGGIVILSIPLIVGIAIPAKPLSASAVDNKGISANAPMSAGGAGQSEVNKAPEKRTVLDWIKIFNYQTDISPFLGQNADVIGFVYHDPRLPSGHFLVSRFAITCCVADATAIGMAVQSDMTEKLTDNTWIEVKGSVQSITVDGHPVPLILADSIQTVKQPDQPYLFP
jgi:putative membrane protein